MKMRLSSVGRSRGLKLVAGGVVLWAAWGLATTAHAEVRNPDGVAVIIGNRNADGRFGGRNPPASLTVGLFRESDRAVAVSVQQGNRLNFFGGMTSVI